MSRCVRRPICSADCCAAREWRVSGERTQVMSGATLLDRETRSGGCVFKCSDFFTANVTLNQSTAKCLQSFVRTLSSGTVRGFCTQNPLFLNAGLVYDPPIVHSRWALAPWISLWFSRHSIHLVRRADSISDRSRYRACFPSRHTVCVLRIPLVWAVNLVPAGADPGSVQEEPRSPGAPSFSRETDNFGACRVHVDDFCSGDQTPVCSPRDLSLFPNDPEAEPSRADNERISAQLPVICAHLPQ